MAYVVLWSNCSDSSTSANSRKQSPSEQGLWNYPDDASSRISYLGWLLILFVVLCCDTVQFDLMAIWLTGSARPSPTVSYTTDKTHHVHIVETQVWEQTFVCVCPKLMCPFLERYEMNWLYNVWWFGFLNSKCSCFSDICVNKKCFTKKKNYEITIDLNKGKKNGSYETAGRKSDA